MVTLLYEQDFCRGEYLLTKVAHQEWQGRLAKERNERPHPGHAKQH